MTTSFHVAATLTVTAFAVAFVASRLNKPYPWNSKVLDNITGVGVLVFIPAFFTTLFQAIWTL